MWWRNLQGGATVQVHLRGKQYTAQAQASRQADAVAHVARQVYPKLTEERAAQFATNKVALRVTLN